LDALSSTLLLHCLHQLDALAAQQGHHQNSCLLLCSCGCTCLRYCRNEIWIFVWLLLLLLPLLLRLRCCLQEATVQELQHVKQLQLHIQCDPQGWNALHYAAAMHKVELVQQLLEIGADPAAADAVCGLTPLHLACMGRVRDISQLKELLEARDCIYDLQVCRTRATLTTVLI
jgi:hypothetical protein